MKVVMPVVEYPIAAPLDDAEVVKVDGDYGYGNLVADLWEAGEDFLLVEQDVLVTPAVRDELAACPELYCAAPYNLCDGRGLGVALGCVRFKGELTQNYPYVATPWRDVHWSVLDGAVDATMSEIVRRRPHVHSDAAVVHLHTGEGDRPTADPYVVIVAESDEWVRFRDLLDDRDWKEART